MSSSNTENTVSHKFEITFDQESYDELSALVEEHGFDLSDFIKNSMRVYNYLLRQHDLGKHVYIGTDGNIDGELVLP